MVTESSESKGQALSFSFTGTGMDYFKIWIVNICLSILTLGIYSAWAKVRTNSFFYGNTVVDDSNFSYLADPVKILIGRIIAVVLFIIYWGAWQVYPNAGIGLLAIGSLLFPFFLVSAMSFRMRNSAYRNIRFYFNKNLKGAYMVFLWPLGLVVLLTWAAYTATDSAGYLDMIVNASEEGGEIIRKGDFIPTAFILALLPVLPWIDYLKTRFIVNHTQYGKANASFSAGALGFYKVYFLTFLAFVALAMIFSVTLGGVFVAFPANENQESTHLPMLMPVFLIVFYGGSFFIAGLWKAMRSNMINNSTMIGDNQLHSQLKGLKVGWIYLTNTIAIICSLAMLIPWAKVRMAKYVAGCTDLNVKDLSSIRSIEQEDKSAFGEEVGEVFDIDLGI
ncbi:MAG: YjgN family protein [Arenicellales bacterium]